MEDIIAMISVPFILFMIFVAPIWVIMHYRSKRQISQGLSEDERNELNQMAARVEAMRERVKTLERILDADSPNWREKL